MNSHVGKFNHWIRNDFIQMNTRLETLYAAQDDRANTEGVGDKIKQQLLNEGNAYISNLLKEGNTDEGFEQAFDLLGNVGFFMAACRRHELTDPAREATSPLVEASGLAMHLGASLGLTPRFATSHLTTHNTAINGRYKSFTTLEAESIFLEYNTRGVLAYKRAADALVRSLPLGISHPVTLHLLKDARIALEDVLKINDELFARLNTDDFFFAVRPYYKPYRVGQHIYRGANAGDFAGINEIDILLGLCDGNNLSYSQLLVDKFLYMMPEDQARLREAMRSVPLLDKFIAAADNCGETDWYRENVREFLNVCRVHGETAAQHHNQLVNKFIQGPSASLQEKHLEKVTASGPPLPVLIRSLEKLRDLRLAAPRDDIPSRHEDIQRLRNSIGPDA
ncbi:MAG: monodechloroaminopyrrolnitrin synthase PrnB family protein [Halioglobus sp.]